MRSSVLAACGLLLALSSALRAQIAWNFTDGTAAASASPAVVNTSALTATNGGTLGISTTSASAGYTGATGGNNAAVSAQAAGTTYFEFTLTPNSAFSLKVSSVSLGSRSTATGPIRLDLYASTNAFASALASATVGANSNWALVSFTGLNLTGAAGTPVTFRLYGLNGTSAAAGNWRIDDLSVTLTGPTFTSNPVNATVESGQTASFSVAASGAGTLSYQWRKAGTALTGNPTATTSTLDLGTVTSTAAGTYDVVVTDSLASTTSTAATLTVNKATATASVGAQTVAYNGTPRAVTVTTAPASLTTTLSYSGSGSTVYGPSASAPTNAGSYTVTATINDTEYQGTGSGTLTISKASATVTLASLTATFDGTSKSATATTNPAGLAVTFTYDGQSSAPVNAGTYAVVATINHQNYSGTATGTLVISPAAATVTLGSLTRTFAGTPLAPTATTAPAGQTVTFTYTGTSGTVYGPTTVAPTDAGTYAVTAALSAPNYTGTTSGTLVISPATQTITFAALADRLTSSDPFTLTATSSSGLPVSFAITSGAPGVATLAGNILTLSGNPGTVTILASQPGNANVLAAPNVERSFQVVAGAVAPEFTLQPLETNAFVGDRVTLTASASGVPAPTYRWTRYGVDISGATSSVLTLDSATAGDTGVYQAIATNFAGTASSARVNLTIAQRPQTITFPIATSGYPSGTSIPLAVSASSGLPVSLALVSGPASLTGSTLIGQGGTVVVRATQAGNATFLPADPVERTFTFVSGGLTPFFSSTPSDQTVNAGSPATLRALALGTPAPTYQWLKNGAEIFGATATSLILGPTTAADAGTYTVVATNALGTARASAQLVVRVAPEIVSAPQDQTVFAGDTATLTVVATGIPPPTYQWRRNGTAIAGATQATFTLGSATAAQAGRYDVVVANPIGSVTTPPATLTVVTRDFAGAYFGQFRDPTGALGEFALFVRPDGTAMFLGHLPGLQTGVAAPALRIGLNGTFSLELLTLANAPAPSLDAGDTTAPGTAAAPRPVTLRGALLSETNEVTGALPELGATFSAARSPATGPAAARAGIYHAAVLGSANARGYAIVGADGQAFLLTADGTKVDSVRGALNDEGLLNATSVGRAVVNLTFANNALTGTARIPNGPLVTLGGGSETVLGTEHLINLSVRATANNAAPLITGFVLTGTAAKQVLIRAAGPALAGAPFNVPNTLADPTIQLFRGNTVTAQNDDWGTPAANVAALTAATTRAGAFPFRAGSGDAALLATLAPGAYTVLIGGGNGAALAEIYEVLQPGESPGTRRLVNLSARGLVAPTSPLIAGLVIGGTAPQRVLIRGVGATLASAPFNLPGTLPNPQLTLYRGTNALVSNDDWFRDASAAAALRDAASRAGAFALGAQAPDAALLLFLEPGAYTVELTSANPTAVGIALIEVYEATP